MRDKDTISDIIVGIPTNYGKTWIGGVNYIVNMITAMTSLPKEERPKVYLVISDGGRTDLGLYSKVFDLVDGFIYWGQNPNWVSSVIKSELKYCQKQEDIFEVIDVMMPETGLAVKGKPVVSWIPDFQYIHLPEFFPEETLRNRESTDRQIADLSKVVILSSDDARKDFMNCFPNSRAVTEVMHFHVSSKHVDYSIDPALVQRKYNLPDRFLICCNQFWEHKDHITVFKAISLLKEKGILANLVCTGMTDDHRNKMYFPRLQRVVKELGIEKQIHILGMIDRQDQIQLMRRSMAVIQPSLFEGWSTVIEDCRVLGRTVIASDLAVNIEQDCPYGYYYKRQDAGDLARVLLDLAGQLYPGQDDNRETIARQKAKDLVREYGRKASSIVAKAYGIFKGNVQHSDGLSGCVHNPAQITESFGKVKADRPVTLFCAPKAFKGNDGVIQRNAIKSWMNFKPSPEIILFGDEEGIKEIADEFGARHVPEIKKNQFGTPLLSDIFQRAKILASNKILTYVNSDIILLDDFAQAVTKTSEKFASFLMVGRRWNLDLHDPIDFNDPNYQQILKEKVKLSGELFMPRAIDYFAFTKELCDQFPPFAIGRPGWDNWFVYKAMMTSNLIDATPFVTAIHQNHDFNHIKGGIKERQKTPDSQKNFALAGKKVVRGLGATDDATWELNANGFERKKPVGYNRQIDEFCDILIARGWESKISIYKKYLESVTRLSNVERPEVSVVVISWKHDPDTIKNFMALASQRNENFELIFVDNGGKPGEFDHLKPYVDTYVKLNTNTGACISRNIGSVFAKANIHLYLDDDGIPGADAIRQCKRAFGEYDIIAARGSVRPKDKNAQPYSSFRNYGDKPFPTFSCQEGITAYDALAFYKVGGWNDKIVFGHEGVELSRRLLILDPDMRKQIYDPMIVLYHDNPTDKDRVEIKKRKQSDARQCISKMFPDYNIFLKYYRLRYFQRPDLLIHKNVSAGAPRNPAEHFYSTEKAKAELKKHRISEYSNKALGLNEQAKALAGQGNTAAAINILKEAVEEEPLFVVGYNNMGLLYCHTGALQNALRAFITSLNIDPLNAETVMYTAKILGATGELPRARALLENHLKNDPNNDQIQKQLSEIATTADVNSSNAIKAYTDPTSTEQPLVTIEMITYDAERFIARAIESVLAQTYSNFELLVVDDGSTDSTADIVRSYSDSRVRYLLKDHKGRWAGTNFAINNARGEFLLAVDSDDFIAPNYVETMVTFAMKNPQSDYYYPQVFELVDQSGNITGDKWTYLDFSDNTILPKFLFEGLHSPIPYPGSLRRMSMFDRTGGYEELENVADFVFLCKNALKVKFAPVANKAAYFYRSYGQSLSHRIEIRNKNMANTLNEMVSIYAADILCPRIANIADPAQKQRQYYKYLAEIFERHVNGHMVQFGQYFKHFADIYRSKMIDSSVDVSRAASTALAADTAKNLFTQGVKFVKTSQPERAIECFKKAEQTGTIIPDLNFARALALAMLGKIERSQDACRAELRLNNTHVGATELLNKFASLVSI